MAAPNNVFAFDLNAAKQAGILWHAREEERNRNLAALAGKEYDAAEPRERLAKRANRLLTHARRALPKDRLAVSEGLRDLISRGPLGEDEIDNLLMERVIGETRDFLSTAFFEAGQEVMGCVGRVVRPLGGGRVSFGTGFLVSPRLLMTNWHVLKTPDAAAAATVEFDFQLDRSEVPRAVRRFRLMPSDFFFSHEELDFALVAVSPTARDGTKLDGFGWCPLIREEGKVILDNCVNIVQHPRGEMKQVVVRENKLVDLGANVLHYEGDTEPGSSGSPVFNDQWEVVALHRTAVPRTDDQGRWIDKDGRLWREGDDPDRMEWVANEGVRISRIVDALSGARISDPRGILREALELWGEPAGPRAPLGRQDPAPQTSPEPEDTVMVERGAAGTGDGSVSITVPLHITVRLGSPTAVVATTQPAGRPEDALESDEPDRDYSNRAGFDPDFLGFSAPLPALGPSIADKAVEVPGAGGGSPHELRYHHFSVIMNGERRIAFVSAVNLDADAPFIFERKGSDRWFFDPRIDEKFQAGNEFYSKNALDRGHLVRRADAAWGSTLEEAKGANDDTFHFPNCAPQHEIFNQSTLASKRGLRLWGNLENHVADQAEDGNHRLSVFNGPIFHSKDPTHRGLQVPRAFWKVVVSARPDGTPSAVAFMLSQADLIKTLPEEEFQPGEFHVFQVRVRDLESRTRLDFGALANADRLEDPGHEGALEAAAGVLPLRRLADIRL